MNTISVDDAKKQFRGWVNAGQYVAFWGRDGHYRAAGNRSFDDVDTCRLAAVLLSVLRSDGMWLYPLDIRLVV